MVAPSLAALAINVLQLRDRRTACAGLLSVRTNAGK